MLVAAPVLVGGSDDMVLGAQSVGVVDVLLAVVVAREVGRYSEIVQDGLEALDQVASGAVLAHTPNREVASCNDEISSGGAEGFVDPRPFCVGSSLVSRPGHLISI